MSGRHHERCKEALSRLPTLDLGELRELWCQLYKTETAPRLSRELLVRAVAYRMQKFASGGPRVELQRQLRRIALETAANRTGQDTSSGKTRHAFDARVAGPKPRGLGAR